LLVADPEDLVENVMAKDVVRFRAEDDVEEAAQAFERYDLVTAHVVFIDDKNLVGMVGQAVEAAQITQHHFAGDIGADADQLEVH
uniref:CBS domain-containing protein n=1 Tax=Neisseria gonorrhoeae TaxID=485 RepID=UPI00384F4B68